MGPNFEFFGPKTQCGPNSDPCRVSLHSIRLPSSCRPRIFWRYIFCISIIFAQVCSLRNHQRPTAVLPCVRAGQQGQQYFDVFEFWLFWNFFLMAGNTKINYRNLCVTTITKPQIVVRLRFLSCCFNFLSEKVKGRKLKSRPLCRCAVRHGHDKSAWWVKLPNEKLDFNNFNRTITWRSSSTSTVLYLTLYKYSRRFC